MATEAQFAGTVASLKDAPFDSSTQDWSNITNIQGDTTGTFADIGGGGPPGATSDGAKCTNFSFTEVSGTINSITVDVECEETTGAGTFPSFRIIKGDAIGSDTTFDASSVPNEKGFFNAAGDLWGETWEDTDITAADFGVVFDVDVDAGFPWSAKIYRVRITVDYTAADQEIAVTESDDTPIASGGTVSVGELASGSTTDVTFKVTNSGSTSDLTISSSPISNTHASLASIQTALPGTISAGATSNLVIRILAGSSEIADLDVTVTINNNDADEGTYVINIDGSVAAAAAVSQTALREIARTDGEILSLPDTSSIEEIVSFNGFIDGVKHRDGRISPLFAQNDNFVDSDEQIIIGGLPVAIGRFGTYLCLMVVVDNSFSDDSHELIFYGSPTKVYKSNNSYVLSCYVTSGNNEPVDEIVLNGMSIAVTDEKRLIVNEISNTLVEEETEAMFGNQYVLFKRVGTRWYLAVRTI